MSETEHGTCPSCGVDLSRVFGKATDTKAVLEVEGAEPRVIAVSANSFRYDRCLCGIHLKLSKPQ